MTANLAITISAADDTGTDQAIWLNLEQAALADGRLRPNDLAQMLARVRSGLSARTYVSEACPVTISGETVIVPVDFYVWPSSLTLPYVVAAAYGELSDPVQVSLARVFSVLVPVADSVRLPYLTEQATAVWETPCYSGLGAMIPPVSLAIDGADLLLDRECFGVLRVSCQAIGYRYTCTMEFTKGNYSITNVRNTVIATWDDDGIQTESLDLELPPCAADLLEACDDGSLITVGTVNEDPAGIPTVYYSTCTGKVIELRYE
jgi:hypothetical protein